jgi:predicted glycosyltransferase
MLANMGGEASKGVKGMRVLFDFVHPANSLVFFHTIKQLKAEGVEVRVVSRHKDVLVTLLDELGIGHSPITTAGEGKLGLAKELLQRDWRLWKVVRQFRPDVMVGFGGVAISHVGKLTGIPSISFYDTEHAGVQLRLAIPFISEWHVPDTWRGRVAEGRTFHFRGGKQFTYLHPDHFQPDPEIARAAGWDEGRDNFMIRTVAWKANHDQGRSGIPPEQLRAIVGHLSALGKVHISAEGPLPHDLEPYRYRGSPIQFHHLLGHCRLYCGESITIASEAVMLGVPVLLQIDKEYCYVTEQEEAGLIRRFGPDDDAVAAIEGALAEDQQSFRQRAQAFVASKGDLNDYILTQIRRVAAARRAAA